MKTNRKKWLVPFLGVISLLPCANMLAQGKEAPWARQYVTQDEPRPAIPTSPSTALIQLANAEENDWGSLSEQEKHVLKRHQAKWQDYSPEQKRHLRNGAQHYLKLSPEEQQGVERERERFESLSPQERRQLREQYKKSRREHD